VLLEVGQGLCTGTLISAHVVLTARHCLQGAGNEDVEVFFGNDALAGNGTWIRSTHVESHPSTDIGAITIAQDAPTEPTPIFEVVMGSDYIGREVLIVGFGETQGQGPVGVKREGVTEISGLQSDVMYVGETGADTCFGDSGGPTFIDEGGDRFVSGVTSFGTSDDCRVGLSGNIRTDLNAGWINTYIGLHDECADDGDCSDQCTAVDPDCCSAGPDDVCDSRCGEPDPDCAALGEECAGNDDCDTNLCMAVEDDARCTQSCASDDECPDDFVCLQGVACWPDGGGCSAAGRGGRTLALPMFLVLLVTLALRPRRRRSPERF
jgi:hypothetical protein